MSNYTPSIEDLSDRFVRNRPLGTRVDSDAEFNRAITKIKADAIREALEAVNVEGANFQPSWGSNDIDKAKLWGIGTTISWLKAHADKIEESAK